MSGRGERLFRAWAEAALPARDEEAGRTRFLEAFGSGGGRRRGPAWRPFSLATATAIACAACLVWWRSAATLHFTTAAGEGQAGDWLATGASAELPLSFSEGTRLVMAPDSRGRVEQLGRAGATFVLERGEVRAHVVHQSNTSWRFRAGPFEVQVTGTALAIDWDPAADRFAVRVTEGAVLVQGPSAGAVHVVRTGERFAMDVGARAMRLSSDAMETADAGSDPDAIAEAGLDAAADGVTAAETPRSSAATPAVATRAWLALEARGEDDAAYAALWSAGLTAVLRTSSAEELLRAARVGRASGHRDTEREALLACRSRFPASEAAGVAAYDLGR
jgi:hypothetical protein